MSKRDLQRIEVLTAVLAGRRTAESAAGVLNVSLRQAQRLLATYKDGVHMPISRLTDILCHREQRTSALS